MSIAIGESDRNDKLAQLLQGLFEIAGADADDSSKENHDDPLAARLTEIEQECAVAARSGEVPLAYAADLLERNGNPLVLEGQESVDAAENLLHGIMARHGLRRRKREPCCIAGMQVHAWTYFVPAEAGLFKAIDGSHPLILTVTAEPRRFMRSVIDRYISDEHARPVFVWTSASGLFEIGRGLFHNDYHAVANAHRTMKDVNITWFDMPALRVRKDEGELRQAEALQKASQFQFEQEIGDVRWKVSCALTSKDSLHAAADHVEADAVTTTASLGEAELDELARIARIGAERVYAALTEKLGEGLKTPDLGNRHFLSL